MREDINNARVHQEALLAALAISLMSIEVFLSLLSGAIFPWGIDQVAGKWELSLGREPQAQRYWSWISITEDMHSMQKPMDKVIRGTMTLFLLRTKIRVWSVGPSSRFG
jgi:hypothetical protein